MLISKQDKEELFERTIELHNDMVRLERALSSTLDAMDMIVDLLPDPNPRTVKKGKK